MRVKKTLKNRLKTAIFGVLFAILGIFGALSINTFISPVNTAYAEPATSETSTTTSESANTTNATEPTNTSETTSDNTSENTETTETCQSQVGALAFIICPGTGVLSQAVDSIYSQIENLLIVEPISFNADSPIFQIWQIMRDITNIVFVIMILVVIYSQLTGVGISNYGIKKALPKLIIAALLVNMSYIICAAGVDLSNIIGSGLRNVFEGIQTTAINNGGLGDASLLSWTDIATAMIGGGAIAGVGIGLAGGLSALLFPFLAAVLGAIISVVIGLFTLGLRQALIAMLVMISPIAFVCYLLPNTEKWFTKWKDLFFSMLFFYPMFSLLYGASQLAGWALIASSVAAGSLFGVILGLAVQILPLILSIALMKMSSTMLGRVSALADKLANKPRDGLRGMAERQSELAKNRRINNSPAATARLQRYLDRRNRKLELETENETRRRRARSEVYAQRSLLGSQKYDPALVDEYKSGKADNGKRSKNRIRTTAATRAAKEAMNLELQAQTAAKDTAHVLGNYGDYHYRTAADRKLAATGAHSYLDLYRATLAEENDAFADEDFVMGEYDKFRSRYNAASSKDNRSEEQREYDFKHYVVGAAGALGNRGDLTVLGEVISKSAANEAKRKAYVNYSFAKYGYNKRAFRNMFLGYYNDDDGFAIDPNTHEKLEFIDKHGVKRTEKFQGELLYYYPEQLKPAAYNKFEIVNGKKEYYFDATDQQGNFIGRIYKSDSPAMKEILQNWDMPICDPINGMYGMLSGVYQGQYAQYGLDGVGNASLSTTIGRALLSSGFKEKASFAGPMYATLVSQRLIKNPIHQHLAILDNLIKTAKPSGFNTQDFAAFQTLALLMDESNWDDMLFDRAALVSYLNVNGESLKVKRTKFDANGNPVLDKDGKPETITIAPENATDTELQKAVVSKFINKAVPKFFNLMSRTTPSIIDNQKPSAQDNWKVLLQNMLTLTNNEEVRKLMDPETIEKAEKVQKDLKTKYKDLDFKEPIDESAGDTLNMANSLKFAMNPRLRKHLRESENRANAAAENNKPFNKTAEGRAIDLDFEDFERSHGIAIGEENTTDHQNQIGLIAAESVGDKHRFINSAREYLDMAMEQDHRIHHVIDDLEGYLIMNPDDSIEDIEQFIKDRLVDYTTY